RALQAGDQPLQALDLGRGLLGAAARALGEARLVRLVLRLTRLVRHRGLASIVPLAALGRILARALERVQLPALVGGELLPRDERARHRPRPPSRRARSGRRRRGAARWSGSPSAASRPPTRAPCPSPPGPP